MEINDALLKKYLEGTLSEEDERLVEAWFLDMRAAEGKASIEEDWYNYNTEKKEDEGTSNRDLLKKTLHFILEHDKEGTAAGSEAIRLKIKMLSLVDEPGTTVPLEKDRKHTGKLIPWPSIAKWAAAVLILFLSGYYSYYALNEKDSIGLAKEQSLRVKSTLPGQKATIYLTDGSKVILNSMSELVYPETFGPGSREISLKGEAFFEVAKDPARPFIVTAGNLTTTALGTSFNVRAYDDDQAVQVALVTGKVRVTPVDPQGQEKVILLPGEAVHYAVTGGKLEKGTFDARKSLSWKENILYFNHTPLQEAFKTLERWYGIDFTINGKEKDLYLNGEFQDQSLKNVLEILSYSNHFSYEIQHDEVLIKLSGKP